MSRLLAIFLVTFFALTSSVLAFSNGPGTCLVSGMKGNPHGATPSKNVTVTTDVKLVSAGTYSITVSGSGSINGLLLYAVDSTGARFGSFSKLPAGFGPKAGCGGTTPATNTLGHINASPKTLPLTFTWSDGGLLSKPNTTASFTGIAMSNTESVWYILSGGEIPAATNATASSGSTTIPSGPMTTPPSAVGSSSASADAASTSAKNTSIVYSYGASASSTTQVAWSLVVAAFLSVFATFLL